MDKFDAFERFEEYTFVDNSRRARRRRRGKNPDEEAVQYRRQKRQYMAEMRDAEAAFVPSYVANLDPQHHERQWVIKSLTSFYVGNQIEDVLSLVKGGKEANVYCCRARPEMDASLLAAKLYRPRMLRTLKNNAIYKEGRITRDSDGKLIHGGREARAMQKKTRFGKDLDLNSWIFHEYRMQEMLYAAGADVPQPYAVGGNTIIMEYLGEAALPAPTLQEVRLPLEEAKQLLRRVLVNAELMLTHHLVHGDLSAYNILYWQGRIAIIDFPQMVDARKNDLASTLLERDVTRVCEYFQSYGIRVDPKAIAADLWHRYMHAEL
jgi:RIO kinase 1